MYISELIVQGYRSLKMVHIKFNKGKNAIIGKNNAGKSNVIKALDLIMGEKYALKRDYEDKDFYCEKIDGKPVYADYFCIMIKICGNDFDRTKVDSMKGSYFTWLKDPIYEINNQVVVLNNVLMNDFDSIVQDENRTFIKNINGRSKEWRKGVELAENLSRANDIYFCLFVSRKDQSKAYLHFIINIDNEYFIIQNSYAFKDVFLSVAVIPSFRNPETQLKINSYSWYGKFIKSIWENNKANYEKKINDAVNSLTMLSESVFHESTNAIKQMLTDAIYSTSVSFKLMNDTADDIYKGIVLYVDDGVDLPFSDKGSGIQSALLIALFSCYCDLFHKGSSVLIAEEPELFLHPQARRALSGELDKFIKNATEDKERQVIISTHSVEFIRNTELQNIILVGKNPGDTKSIITQIDLSEISETELQKVKQVIWTKNAEMFFADFAILVEGGEEYLIPKIFDFVSGKPNNLDYLNISVVRCGGKDNFLTYAKILNTYGIKWVIVADLDVVKNRTLTNLLTLLGQEHEKWDEIKTAISNCGQVNSKDLRESLVNSSYRDANKFVSYLDKMATGDVTFLDESFNEFYQYVKTRYCKVDINEAIKNANLQEEFSTFIRECKNRSIWIWSQGELEDYYTEFASEIDGITFGKTDKDRWAQKISEKLSEGEDAIKYISLDEFVRLFCLCGNAFSLCKSGKYCSKFNENDYKEYKCFDNLLVSIFGETSK